ncbi:ALLC Allantoicase, partial [Polypterus senegalus]
MAKKKWDSQRDAESRQEYKEIRRKVKREVAKAKEKAYDELYERLDTKEREKDLYQLARQRDQAGKDLLQDASMTEGLGEMAYWGQYLPRNMRGHPLDYVVTTGLEHGSSALMRPVVIVRGRRDVCGPLDDSTSAALGSHDWCIIKLGVPGVIHGFDVDTSFFTGNYAPHISIQAVCLQQDGGIARLKVYGIGQKDWSEVSPTQKVDLVALVNGGVCIGFSDAHFGHPRNMIDSFPYITKGMVDENGILQVPGSEWAVFKLGHIGVITEIQIDTTHFKGNFPDSCKIDACSMTSVEEMTRKWESDDVTDWKPLLVTQKLKPHHQHFFTGSSIQLTEAVTHVKITMAPDGGISRMRLWGYLRSSPSK